MTPEAIKNLDEIERRDYAGELDRPGWSCKVPDLRVEESEFRNDVYLVYDGDKTYLINPAICKHNGDWYCQCKSYYCDHISALKQYLGEKAADVILEAQFEEQRERLLDKQK